VISTKYNALKHWSSIFDIDSLDVLPHETKEKVFVCPDGFEQRFPFYVARWKKGDTKFALLMEPKVRVAECGGFLTKRTRHFEDIDAMRDELCKQLKITNPQQGGFSLIEMAVVLLIAGMLAVAAMQFTGSIILNAQNSLIRSNFETLKGGIVWKTVQTRMCVPPAAEPCNATTFTYTLPPATQTFSAMGFNQQSANDPWGKPYAYSITTQVITPNVMPGNVAFAIASSGPDGVADNMDDIKLTVYVIELQSMFAKF